MGGFPLHVIQIGNSHYLYIYYVLDNLINGMKIKKKIMVNVGQFISKNLFKNYNLIIDIHLIKYIFIHNLKI